MSLALRKAVAESIPGIVLEIGGFLIAYRGWTISEDCFFEASFGSLVHQG
jgi:hypothetical protein